MLGFSLFRYPSRCQSLRVQSEHSSPLCSSFVFLHLFPTTQSNSVSPLLLPAPTRSHVYLCCNTKTSGRLNMKSSSRNMSVNVHKFCYVCTFFGSDASICSIIMYLKIFKRKVLIPLSWPCHLVFISPPLWMSGLCPSA